MTLGAASVAPGGFETAPARKILLYSDSKETRAAVRRAVGNRLGPRGAPVVWTEVATPAVAVIEAERLEYSLIIADAEAAKLGGIGLARQLGEELPGGPPVLILVARPQDAWLASWSGAAETVVGTADPFELGRVVARLLGDD